MQVGIREFTLMGVAASGGEIKGRTELQKRVYFLGVITGLVDPLGYRAHYYGPYSSEVADSVAELRSLGYVHEEATSFGVEGSTGFEICRHDFRLTGEGQEAVGRLKRRHPNVWEQLRKASVKMRAAGRLNYVELSIAAKAYWLLTRHGGKATLDALRGRASQLGWTVTEGQLDKAVSFLEKVGLVTRDSRT